MRQTKRNKWWSKILTGGCLAAAIISCAAAGPTHSAKKWNSVGRIHSESQDAEDGNIVKENTTAAWVFGIQSAPERAKKIGARGVRGIVDLRKFHPAALANVLQKYANLDLGFCLTLRWRAPTRTGKKAVGAARVDVPPTPEEAENSIEQVVALLNTPAALQLGEKLWVQLYNEISGGPGRFGEDDEDAMFEYATRLATRIRADAPLVKIVGPALTAVHVLDRADNASLTRIQKLRYQRLLRTISWSARFADAVDLHLHAENGNWATEAIRTVREVLDQQPGGLETEIVSLEWSCARFKNRSDAKAVRSALDEIWKALNDNGVALAAYAGYWPGKNQKEIHQWKSLVDLEGNPKEPFYSFFIESAHQKTNIATSNK